MGPGESHFILWRFCTRHCFNIANHISFIHLLFALLQKVTKRSRTNECSAICPAHTQQALCARCIYSFYIRFFFKNLISLYFFIMHPGIIAESVRNYLRCIALAFIKEERIYKLTRNKALQFSRDIVCCFLS